MPNPIVFSSSAISSFRRCPKAYQYGYEMLLDPAGVPQYLADGSSVHKLLADRAKGLPVRYEWTDMEKVTEAYLAHHPLPANILMVEEPMYTEILPNVYIRTTFDLVYKDRAIRGRDYKTYERAPSLDLDLDFQGRVYIAALQRRYPDEEVEFEYEYIRRTPPGVPHNKRGEVWVPEECYLTFPLVISRKEADQLWEETQWVVEQMLETIGRGRFFRSDQKGWGGCESCFYKNICKAELQHGHLDEQDLALLAPNRREPMTLPEELK